MARVLVAKPRAAVWPVRYCEQQGFGCSCRRMPVKKVQQSVPVGTDSVVEPPTRPPSPWVPPERIRPTPPEPPPGFAEDPLEYPCDDELPIATNPFHFEWMMTCHRTLQHRYRGRRDLYLGCDMLVYYERGNREAAVAPDVFVSFGVPPRNQLSYFVWLEGKPPDAVWEFGAPLTVKGDAGEKKETYRRMGVWEYWLVDPVGGYHDPRVQGFQLVDGAYEQMPWEDGPDGMVAVWSPLLQLEQRFAEGRLRFWDRETAQYLELPEEESARLLLEERKGRLEAERGLLEERKGRLEERKARQRAEQDLEAEKRARNAPEARIAELEGRSE